MNEEINQSRQLTMQLHATLFPQKVYERDVDSAETGKHCKPRRKVGPSSLYDASTAGLFITDDKTRTSLHLTISKDPTTGNTNTRIDELKSNTTSRNYPATVADLPDADAINSSKLSKYS